MATVYTGVTCVNQGIHSLPKKTLDAKRSKIQNASCHIILKNHTWYLHQTNTSNLKKTGCCKQTQHLGLPFLSWGFHLSQAVWKEQPSKHGKYCMVFPVMSHFSIPSWLIIRPQTMPKYYTTMHIHIIQLSISIYHGMCTLKVLHILACAGNPSRLGNPVTKGYKSTASSSFWTLWHWRERQIIKFRAKKNSQSISRHWSHVCVCVCLCSYAGFTLSVRDRMLLSHHPFMRSIM